VTSYLLRQIVAKMEFDDGVKMIEGAKLDSQAMWLLVRWESGKQSFVPAQVFLILPFSLARSFLKLLGTFCRLIQCYCC
jgi:hypothetical protein